MNTKRADNSIHGLGSTMKHGLMVISKFISSTNGSFEFGFGSLWDKTRQKILKLAKADQIADGHIAQYTMRRDLLKSKDRYQNLLKSAIHVAHGKIFPYKITTKWCTLFLWSLPFRTSFITLSNYLFNFSVICTWWQFHILYHSQALLWQVGQIHSNKLTFRGLEASNWWIN